MDRTQHTSLAMTMVLTAVVAAPTYAIMQESVLAADTAPVAVTPKDPGPPAVDPEKLIRFNFTEAPYSAVLEAFSRESGLPMIREAEAPSSTMTFISGSAYTFDDALGILNQFLRMHNVYVAHEDNYLYFRTLKDEARQALEDCGKAPEAGVGIFDLFEILGLRIPDVVEHPPGGLPGVDLHLQDGLLERFLNRRDLLQIPSDSHDIAVGDDSAGNRKQDHEPEAQA